MANDIQGGSMFSWGESAMSGVKRGKQGTPTQGIEVSPARRKRLARRRAKQEERWARRSSEVTVRSMTDEERREFGVADDQAQA